MCLRRHPGVATFFSGLLVDGLARRESGRFTARAPARRPYGAAVALATVALPLGFAVAQATGVRPVGGAVFAGLGIASLVLARPAAWRGALLAAVALGGFAVSHALADPLGTWGAVAAVTAVTGAAAAVLLQGAS